MLAGALTEPSDTAILLFQGESPAVAEQFAKADPYVTKGLVLAYQVRHRHTVVGELARAPTRPAWRIAARAQWPVLPALYYTLSGTGDSGALHEAGRQGRNRRGA